MIPLIIYVYGQGGNVSKALECIVQSEYLCMQHDLRNMVPAGALFRGAGLERLGGCRVNFECLQRPTIQTYGGTN